MQKWIYVSLFLIGLGLSGCSKNPGNPEYQKEIVVNGFLWGNKPMTADRAIMISYTQPITDYYDPARAVIGGASVRIIESGTGRTFILTDPVKPGFYFNENLIAQPNVSYTLQLAVDGKNVSATTTIPSFLGVETTLSSTRIDSFYYNGISKERPIFLTCDVPEQLIIVDLYCNEDYQNARYITQFWGREKPNSLQDYGGPSGNDEPRHITASAKIKELSSEDFPGQIVIDWYTSMLVFYGSYTLQVLAIDENYNNFINNRQFPELKAGIVGGIGVFGSVCGETFQLYVLKR